MLRGRKGSSEGRGRVGKRLESGVPFCTYPVPGGVGRQLALTAAQRAAPLVDKVPRAHDEIQREQLRARRSGGESGAWRAFLAERALRARRR